MSQCASAEESGCSVEDKSLTEFWDVDGSHKLEGGTILGPLQNVTGLGMDGGCLVDWTPVKPYEEPKVTYSVSYGCTAGWSNNFSLKTLFIWFRENSHEFIVGITIALTLVSSKITRYRMLICSNKPKPKYQKCCIIPLSSVGLCYASP